MMKDYRINRVKAECMSSREIVDAVLFAIADDAPAYSDDTAMEPFLSHLNPVIAATFSAWMATGFIGNGGLFQIYEACSAGMISRAAHGFRLLGKEDIAYALELSARAFPNAIVPTSADERQYSLELWSERLDSGAETVIDQTLAGLNERFSITDAYDGTDSLIGSFRYEFVAP
jgi:hypothetical protein